MIEVNADYRAQSNTEMMKQVENNFQPHYLVYDFITVMKKGPMTIFKKGFPNTNTQPSK